MQKAYKRIEWENYPSDKTPVNEENLNKIDVALDEIDNRTINLDANKATKTEVSALIADIAWNESTGVITFTRKNGATISLDTKLEKLAVNFAYDQENDRLVITLDDGTKQYVDMSALITQYEFLESDTIAFVLEGGKVRAVLKEGCVEEKHLRPDYLADIKVETATSAANATAAAKSAAEVATSEKNAKTSETNAAVSEAAAKTSETNAKESEEAAATSESNAKNYSTAAGTSATNAAKSASAAATSATTAQSGASTATEKATEASESADAAQNSAKSAAGNATLAGNFAQQAERIAEGLKGSLLPMGTITFAELPTSPLAGWMYNISDEFTTDARFNGGAGIVVSAGSDVYYTAEGKWDVMAGSPVSGVKGSAESAYRRGNVNITAANVGLGNVPNVKTNDQTPTYTVASVLATLKSGEKLSVAFGKIMLAITTLIEHMANTVPHITSAERSAWNAKQDAISGGASTIASSNLTKSRALVSDSNGKVAVSGVTATELGYLSGATENIQARLNKLRTTNNQQQVIMGMDNAKQLIYFRFAHDADNTELSNNQFSVNTEDGSYTVLEKDEKGNETKVTYYPVSTQKDVVDLAHVFRMYTSSNWGILASIEGITARLYSNLNTFIPMTASAFNVNSSRRYKHNIEIMAEERAKKLLDVEVVTYDYNEGIVLNPLDKSGVIAEDVAEIFPEVVSYATIDGESVPDGVDYSKFVPSLIKMVQIQQNEIEELKAKLQ